MATIRLERADDVRVVGEVDRPHLDHRVVVDEVVQAPRAHDERRHDLAAVALLACPGDDAGLDEVDDGVGEHLGVDAEVVLVAQGQRGGGRDRPDPELEGRPVGHELRDEFADPPLDGADRTDRVLVRRHVHLDRQVDVVDVDEALAERSWHRAIELDDDRRGGPDRRVHRLDAGAQRAEPVTVGRRGVDEHASSGSAPESNRRGTSERKTGT